MAGEISRNTRWALYGAFGLFGVTALFPLIRSYQAAKEESGSQASHREAVAGLQPIDRTAYDYLGALLLGKPHSACLDNTPYDFMGGSELIEPANFSYLDGTVTLTPADDGATPLRLKNIGPDSPLQGADPASEIKLADLGCPTQPYAQEPR